MTLRLKPTADEVRFLRDAEGISMFEAEKRLRRELLLDGIASARERLQDPHEWTFKILDILEDMIREPL